MRTWILAALVLIATPATARADLGIGLFVGEPLGLDVKIDLARRQALDLVFGVTSVRRGGRDYSYGHLTYLVTPLVVSGSSVLVPLRLGLGVSVFGLIEGDVNIAGRVPFEVGFMFRSVPLEIYLEVALQLLLVSEDGGEFDLDGQGGVGLRFYF